ncbi:MAG: winged helix-turn-helix transcriptional regulator [Muribaculaceae bacterium]|nr:winged helix-turn-helix transcriptional regulator [Muribaculaceae bacterium]
MSDIQTKVIELIKNNPSITHAEIAKALSITQRTVERTTKKLRDLRIIGREGSDKTGIWKLF